MKKNELVKVSTIKKYGLDFVLTKYRVVPRSHRFVYYLVLQITPDVPPRGNENWDTGEALFRENISSWYSHGAGQPTTHGYCDNVTSSREIKALLITPDIFSLSANDAPILWSTRQSCVSKNYLLITVFVEFKRILYKKGQNIIKK